MDKNTSENTAKTPEQTQHSEHQTEVKKQPVGSKFLHVIREYADMFSKSFFTPSVLTVMITAVLAPFVVDKINSDMENKKLQKQVIEKMLDYTAQTDFSQPEALEKITIISKMVDENKLIFGLSFSETDNVIQNLYGEISKVGLANLNSKRKEFESKISELKSQLAADTLEIVSLQMKQISLQEKLKSTNTTSLKNQYKDDLAKVTAELQPKIDNKNLINKQIQYWVEQMASLNKDISDAQEDLATLLQNKREKEAELKRSLANKGEIEEKFKKLVEQNGLLNEQVSKLDTINKALSHQVESMKKEIESLKAAEKERETVEVKSGV